MMARQSLSVPVIEPADVKSCRLMTTLIVTELCMSIMYVITYNPRQC